MSKSTIAKRLKELIEHHGENQNSFSLGIGYGPPTTAKILGGKNYPGYEYICAILTKYPRVNARWLLLGEGTMFKK